MFIQRIRGIQTLLVATQAIFLSATFWLAYVVLTVGFAPGSTVFLGDYTLYWAVMLGGFLLESLSRGQGELVAPLTERSMVRLFPIALRQLTFTYGGLLLLLAFTKDLAISRVFLGCHALVLYAVLLWGNATLPSWFARTLFSGARENGTLLVGPTPRLAQLHGWLARKAEFGIRIVGLVQTDTAPPPGDIPLLGDITALAALARSADISQIILLESASPTLAKELIAICQQRGLRLLIVNDFAEQLGHPTVTCMDEGINIITLHEEPLENPFHRVLKRLLDVAIALPVVVLILPCLILLVWLLQRLQSPGPLWHKQERAGLQNHPFQIMKFRTMHPSSGDEARQATEGDARIYPSGRWLRRFSLDEFPQFLNVLRGEMSVVGPRPHLVQHNRQFAEVMASYHFRTFIKPGITGLAQVRGFRGEARTSESIAARLQSDLIYLENWSLSLELGIIVRTVWQMISPPSSAR